MLPVEYMFAEIFQQTHPEIFMENNGKVVFVRTKMCNFFLPIKRVTADTHKKRQINKRKS